MIVLPLAQRKHRSLSEMRIHSSAPLQLFIKGATRETGNFTNLAKLYEKDEISSVSTTCANERTARKTLRFE